MILYFGFYPIKERKKEKIPTVYSFSSLLVNRVCDHPLQSCSGGVPKEATCLLSPPLPGQCLVFSSESLRDSLIKCEAC